MGVHAYNVADLVADLYARIPTVDLELELLMGNTTIGDFPPTLWQYDVSSGATDNYAGNPLTATIIKPTAQAGNGRWIKRAMQMQSDWNSAISYSPAFIANKPALVAVATSGAYSDLTGKPSLTAVATSGAYGDLTGKPSLAAVATSGAYSDLTGKPTLATVATSGSYNDLSNKPAIPSTTRTTSTQSISLVGTGATGTQISATNDSTVRFTVSTSTTSTIGGPATSVVTLKKCITNSATEGDWTSVAILESDQTITLAIVLQSVQVVKGQLSTDLPAGWFVKLVNTGTGTHSEAFVSGEKTIYG